MAERTGGKCLQTRHARNKSSSVQRRNGRRIKRGLVAVRQGRQRRRNATIQTFIDTGCLVNAVPESAGMFVVGPAGRPTTQLESQVRSQLIGGADRPRFARRRRIPDPNRRYARRRREDRVNKRGRIKTLALLIRRGVADPEVPTGTRHCDVRQQLLVEQPLPPSRAKLDTDRRQMFAIRVAEDHVLAAGEGEDPLIEAKDEHGLQLRMAATFNRPDEDLIERRRCQPERQLGEPGVERCGEPVRRHLLGADRIDHIIQQLDQFAPDLPVLSCLADPAVIFSSHRPRLKLAWYLKPL